MIKESIIKAFSRLYPTVLILIVIICSIRLAWLIKNNQKIVLPLILSGKDGKIILGEKSNLIKDISEY